ncbi:poly(A) RNA polymerase cid11-like [Dorcoceras hygrometricum]|uniref:Poly(A) RNA polymerase cid11-like n=1 Tax=Dorcoceras hygrometricum TaxID=472368 RepID=A0A2Z7BK40_9LAMI|nr:poly(A) RNA polymerase cid11-like [Dorcoceras hygrometricum]
MNGDSTLELILKDILLAINPSREDWSARFHTISELRAIIESIDSLRGATLEPFGSFASNLFTRWGDLDISVKLQNGSNIACLGRKHKQILLRDILKALRKKYGWGRIQFISNARVPILKLVSSYGISCDISIDNSCGQMKSKLLFSISEMDGRFRDLVLLVKEWAKAHNINDPKSGSLNSYCLSLLVVYHLQTVEPAILPPLREIYPGNLVDDLTGMRTVAVKRIEDICAVNINRLKSDRSRLINRCSLAELFISFLAKFAYICSRASEQGISTFSGRLEDIYSNMRWLPNTCPLFVEDPFEQPANAARTVGGNQMTMIVEAIQGTQSIILSPRQKNHTAVVSVLVRSDISHSVARQPIANSATVQSLARNPATDHSRNDPSNHLQAQRKQMSLHVVKPSQAFSSQRQENVFEDLRRLLRELHSDD